MVADPRSNTCTHKMWVKIATYASHSHRLHNLVKAFIHSRRIQFPKHLLKQRGSEDGNQKYSSFQSCKVFILQNDTIQTNGTYNDRASRSKSRINSLAMKFYNSISLLSINFGSPRVGGPWMVHV